MIRQFGTYAFVAVLAMNLIGTSAQAHWGKVQVTDGSGDGIEVHSYPFGLGKGVHAQDQLGDSFGYKKGLFGINRTTEAQVLGNGFKVHHGLLGTKVDGQSMFGDTVKSHKVLGIGPRITTVNLQGIHGVASGLLNHSAMPNMSQSMPGGAFGMGGGGGYGRPAEGISPGGTGPFGNAGALSGSPTPESMAHPAEGLREPLPMAGGGSMVDPSAYANP